MSSRRKLIAAGVVFTSAVVGIFSLRSIEAAVGPIGIVGSAHDFSRYGWANNQACVPCHGPHDTIISDPGGRQTSAPAWNHTLSTARYVLYREPRSGTLVNGEVDATSRLCLSCHDGTVALDSFGGMSGSAFMTNPRALRGTDLSRDHPIGEAAVWPSPTPRWLVEPSLRDARGIMPLQRLSDQRFVVGCLSCHEPHNRGQGPALLWVNNSSPGTTVDGRHVNGSVLCQNCHRAGDQSGSGSGQSLTPHLLPAR